MRYDVERALRDAGRVGVPPVPLEAIRRRAGRRAAFGRARRATFAAVAAAISMGLLAFSARPPQSWHPHAAPPTPIASAIPGHAVT